MIIRPYHPEDEAAVIELWDRCSLTRSWNNPAEDIKRKLQVNPELFLVGVLENEITATVMAGYEGHRGWINYLAVDPRHRLKGFGSSMMREAEKALREMGCAKINLLIREDNMKARAFYESLDFKKDEVVCYGKRLISDV